MMQELKAIWLAAKYFLFIFAVFFTGFFSLFLIIENRGISSELRELKLSEELFVSRNVDYFVGSFGRAVSDLEYLSEGFDIEGEDVEKKWEVVLESNGTYNKIRYIDLNGDEVLRLDYFEGSAFAPGPGSFANVRDETYFTAAIALDEGQVHISEINFVENGDYPQELSIMFCTPVYERGSAAGILVMDWNVKFMLDQFGQSLVLGDTRDEVYLINDDGYWTAGSGEFKKVDVQYYEIVYGAGLLPPEKWEKLKEQKHYITESGMYTFEEIDIAGKIETAGNANQDGNIFRQTHCKIITLIKSGTDRDYFIYNDFGAKFKKIFSQRCLYFIGSFFAAALIVFLLIKNKSNLERMRYSSHYDHLTKVYNRRQGLSKLEEAVGDISHYGKISICFMDIDGLKEVNDNLGHCFGDELIITVTSTILNIIRDDDMVIRMGGDEFIIVFKRVGKAIAQTIWTRIEAAFKGINSMEDRKYIISASHGIAEIDAGIHKIDINAAITRADDKMYEEKMRRKKILNVIRRTY